MARAHPARACRPLDVGLPSCLPLDSLENLFYIDSSDGTPPCIRCPLSMPSRHCLLRPPTGYCLLITAYCPRAPFVPPLFLRNKWGSLPASFYTPLSTFHDQRSACGPSRRGPTVNGQQPKSPTRSSFVPEERMRLPTHGAARLTGSRLLVNDRSPSFRLHPRPSASKSSFLFLLSSFHPTTNHQRSTVNELPSFVSEEQFPNLQPSYLPTFQPSNLPAINSLGRLRGCGLITARPHNA